MFGFFCFFCGECYFINLMFGYLMSCGFLFLGLMGVMWYGFGCSEDVEMVVGCVVFVCWCGIGWGGGDVCLFGLLGGWWY